MDHSSQELAAELAQRERRASATVPLGGARWILIALFVTFVVALVLPHSGSVSGLDVLFRSDKAMAASTSTIEMSYVWLALIAQLLGLAVAVTANRALAQMGVVVTITAAMFSMLAVWKRQVRGPGDLGTGPGIGLFLASAATFVLVLVLIVLTIQRTEEQWQLDAQRRTVTPKSELALAQLEVLEAKRAGNTDPFTDDRRDRAKRRRQRMLGQDGTQGDTTGGGQPGNTP
ncbi:hypothetical protein ACFSSC_04660 [Corynebacterium mendelii]|uniref:Uncharacterized protein n=1 Tax=Corynebacterium mendelii TaxID=2765362 RepID=A0A939ISZ8_9CORY|nr:hypothetical protein [Corynebacterium mendelii]MBN9643309.1 hypothetical protein [Corynebacterium mendelii]